MYCSKCGKENKDESSFCCNCGNPLQPIKAQTYSKENIYFALVVISNVLALLCPIIPMISVYSGYDNRDHGFNLVRYLLHSESLQDATKVLLKDFRSYDENLLLTIYSWIFLVSICIFTVLSILFSGIFLYKIAMGNRDKEMLRASMRAMIFVIINMICVVVYSVLHAGEIEVTFGVIIILACAILNILVFHKLYIKESALDFGKSRISANSAFLKINCILLLIIISGLAIGVYCRYQNFRTPLYSKQTGWDINGEWTYNGNVIRFDSNGNVIYEEGDLLYKGEFYTNYLISIRISGRDVYILIFDSDGRWILNECIPNISEKGLVVNFTDTQEGSFSVNYKHDVELYITPQRIYVKYGTKGFEYERKDS